jgi:hypothetical protein
MPAMPRRLAPCIRWQIVCNRRRSDRPTPEKARRASLVAPLKDDAQLFQV